jgi:hypothetical protein
MAAVSRIITGYNADPLGAVAAKSLRSAVGTAFGLAFNRAAYRSRTAAVAAMVPCLRPVYKRDGFSWRHGSCDVDVAAAGCAGTSVLADFGHECASVALDGGQIHT